MKNKLILLATLVFLPAAFAVEAGNPAQPVAATGSLDSAPSQKLEKFMVTGSLEAPASQPAQLEKFLVTGSLEEPAGETKALEKFMVTGSLEDPADGTAKLEKFMVTGSRESRPMIKLRHKR
jgi:hypothetical protein